ncbi:hypothetical protein [Pseudodesulfovibrio sediminis]|uniref:Uncharacterized protein n=1 Tax=Pseudodesulfovibrio sediminis TaxID=2810563 RepID=A0ABM7P9A4_9BACT|nr:hypothetical protein [Pseudodesulfovibrio sediminis]BCS89538.1 hypothetical protein PSDVSF_27800 [Pseudodesulfovibrio sediminis]
MLSFNTCFPVSIDATIDKLLLIGKTWRRNSPHSTINELIDLHFCSANECHIENNSESLHFQKHFYDQTEIGGIRHTVLEGDINWVTEIVGYKTKTSYWVSIKVFKESSLPLLDDHESKKPHIVKLIMKEMGVGFDGDVPVGDKPIFLKTGDEIIAQKAMGANLGCVMPTVYVSVRNTGKHNIKYNAIAERLSGMAHVLVEPSVQFSRNLRVKVDDINAYNGAVGIYWPGGTNRLYFVQRGKYINPNRVANDVCRVVRQALLSQRGIKKCTWFHLQEIKSKIKLSDLKKSGSNKLEEYINTFDEELEATKSELDLARREIEQLNTKLYTNTMSTPVPGTPALIKGNEDEKYQGETTDMLLEILEKQIHCCEVGTRRKDIIEDILSTNSCYGNRKKLLARLKETFKKYQKLDGKTRGELDRMAFSISEEGKHYKLNFKNDNRYTVVLPKTSSDYRAGLNTYSDLQKKMF